LGIHNVFALRGDAQKGSRVFIPKENGHAHTTDLMQQIANMNKGIYLDDALKSPVPTQFSMGVACYPEKHIEAPNLETDIQFLKEKVKLGAEYAVTQLFYDNRKYFDFVDRVRKEGIDIPIIPGIKPFRKQSQLTIIPKTFKVDIPQELALEALKCKTDEEASALGIEWCINQCQELIKHGVPSIHFYTVGAVESIKQVAKAIY
jgi:methylenetetrahydrofolate reductase (NADPH)